MVDGGVADWDRVPLAEEEDELENLRSEICRYFARLCDVFYHGPDDFLYCRRPMRQSVLVDSGRETTRNLPVEIALVAWRANEAQDL